MSGTIEETEIFDSFSLLGGPLHRLGLRLGLVRGDTNTFSLGIALGASLWTVLVVIALAQGLVDQLFSLAVVGPHVRLLLVIPLFFLSESRLDPRMTSFVSTIVRSGVVPEAALPTLESEIARTARMKDSWQAEAICLLAAVLLSLSGRHLPLSVVTSGYDSSRGVADFGLTGLWHLIVCLPLFRFLIFRWIWRIGLWTYFLWRVARLDLHLVPTHPDEAGGLGYLEVVHSHFAPLILAMSATQSAALAEEISAGKMTLEAIYPAIALMLFVEAAVFVGPLLILTPKLWACRVKGLRDYTEFASNYVRAFDEKWLRKNGEDENSALGTPDLQSLADLANSVNVVRRMRLLPVSARLFVILAIPALLPLLPLLLLKYPIAELVEGLFKRLAGL